MSLTALLQLQHASESAQAHGSLCTLESHHSRVSVPGTASRPPRPCLAHSMPPHARMICVRTPETLRRGCYSTSIDRHRWQATDERLRAPTTDITSVENNNMTLRQEFSLSIQTPAPAYCIVFPPTKHGARYTPRRAFSALPAYIYTTLAVRPSQTRPARLRRIRHARVVITASKEWK